ncbi:MAG: tRNA lysidine(34) synthetase TilS [Bacteroidetes bacterium]|nr:tRNA lysidine(34) synthetase TilS [Bacteroidota bacterium]
MLSSFIKNIESKQLFTKNHKLLLGVSGGKDSMALADLLLKAGYNFSVAHCNFCLRKEEADLEEAFVVSYFQEKNIPVFSIRFNTQEHADANKQSIQMAARELRYNWFKELKTEHQFDYIVTAHHLNDNIETFFINVLRGAGINGLKGVPEKTETIVRPLLFASSEQIKEYITRNNLKYKEDSSNSEVKYLRNKLRHELVPLLKEINPKLEETFSKEFNYFREANNLIEETIAKEIENISSNTNNEVSYEIKKVLDSSHIGLLLHYILKQYSFDSSIETQVLEAIKAGQSGKLFMSKTHTCLVDRESIIIKENNNTNILLSYTIEKNTKSISEPLNLHFEIVDEAKIIVEDNLVCLDFEKLSFPLQIRKWQEGDSFQPLGMQGTKKLSDFFINQKYTLFQKEEQWLLTSKNEIVWIIGKRIDNRFKVTETTKQTLILKLNV